MVTAQTAVLLQIDELCPRNPAGTNPDWSPKSLTGEFCGHFEACCLSALSRGIANSQEERDVNMDATSQVDPKQISENMTSQADSYLESESPSVKSRCETSPWKFVNVSSSKWCSNGSMCRKPLFPSRTDTIADPLTKQPRKRRWWHPSIAGSSVPSNALIDRHGETRPWV